MRFFWANMKNEMIWVYVIGAVPCTYENDWKEKGFKRIK